MNKGGRTWPPSALEIADAEDVSIDYLEGVSKGTQARARFLYVSTDVPWLQCLKIGREMPDYEAKHLIEAAVVGAEEDLRIREARLIRKRRALDVKDAELARERADLEKPRSDACVVEEVDELEEPAKKAAPYKPASALPVVDLGNFTVTVAPPGYGGAFTWTGPVGTLGTYLVAGYPLNTRYY